MLRPAVVESNSCTLLVYLYLLRHISEGNIPTFYCLVGVSAYYEVISWRNFRCFISLKSEQPELKGDKVSQHNYKVRDETLGSRDETRMFCTALRWKCNRM